VLAGKDEGAHPRAVQRVKLCGHAGHVE